MCGYQRLGWEKGELNEVSQKIQASSYRKTSTRHVVCNMINKTNTVVSYK